MFFRIAAKGCVTAVSSAEHAKCVIMQQMANHAFHQIVTDRRWIVRWLSYFPMRTICCIETGSSFFRRQILRLGIRNAPIDPDRYTGTEGEPESEQ
ncbi:hypothetical protein [Yoonia vestfoldensis]|uniref:hypothetical protein n=1 Tax=Yoonia vestfoldensis TaxID=245188 RepID=UPI000368621E|nr:hypothetical protein [Yoonia vestfoldensis]